MSGLKDKITSTVKKTLGKAKAGCGETFSRDNLKNCGKELTRTLCAVLISFAIAIVIIMLSSENPFEAVRVFALGAFSDPFTRGKIITESVPLIFTGVAVCIMIKCGQFNMIGEGTFYIGGLVGAVVTTVLNLPPIILPLVAIIVAGAVSGIIGYAPAKLKASLGVNEFVSSLMMNFILLWVGVYFLTYHFSDPDYSDIATSLIPQNGMLPFLSETNQISSSFILGLVFVILAGIFLYKTKWGYAIRMTGDNKNFAEYSGINSKRAIVYSQVIGASIAGMGGASFILGNFYRFNWKALPNYGFDGFIIAIMARNNPFIVPIVALFFGYLRTGASEMARLTDVSNEVVFIIQAIMIILIGANAFLSGQRAKKAKNKKETASKNVDTKEAI